MILLSKTTKTAFFAILILLSASSPVMAKPQPVIEKMQALKVLEGKWDMQVESTMDGGKTWQKAPITQVDIHLAHKGRLLREIPVNPLEKGFNMETYLSFDQYRNVYRKAAIDDVWGIMDIYEGAIEDNKLVMTNLKGGTTFPMGNDIWRAFRLTIELTPDNRKMIIDASDDNGETWKPAFVAKYTRAN